MNGRVQATEIGFETYRRLTAAIYGAATDPVLWPQVLCDIADAAGGVQPHIIAHDHVAHRSSVFHMPRTDPDYVDSYRAHFSGAGPWDRPLAEAPAGRTFSSAEVFDESRIERTEFYSDWLRPQGKLIRADGQFLQHGRERSVLFGGIYGRAAFDRLVRLWPQYVDLLAPHMTQALEISRLLAEGKVALAGAALAGDVGSAALAISAERRILWANAPAEALLAEGRLLRRGLRETLSLALPEGPQLIERALEMLEPSAVERCLKLPLRLAEGQIWHLRAAPLAPQARGIGDFALTMDLDRPCLLLTFERIRRPQDPDALIAQAFGMTRAEAEVSHALWAGGDAQSIATARAASIHTVRNQVKAAMAKAGTRRQSELVREIDRLLRSH